MPCDHLRPPYHRLDLRTTLFLLDTPRPLDFESPTIYRLPSFTHIFVFRNVMFLLRSLIFIVKQMTTNLLTSLIANNSTHVTHSASPRTFHVFCLYKRPNSLLGLLSSPSELTAKTSASTSHCLTLPKAYCLPHL